MEAERLHKQIIVPMVSPVTVNGLIDEWAVEQICRTFVKSKVDVFVLGTTGEGDSIAQYQREQLVKYTVNSIQGNQKVFAGLTGNSLSESIIDAKRYADLGIDYLVAKLPAYYPMNEKQMLVYIEKLADSVSLPLYIYNIPATTHHSIPLEIIEQLSYHPNLWGLKDSERNIVRLNESIQLWANRKDFDFLIGWAAMSAYGLQKGANGIVPSTGNICPELYAEMVKAVLDGNEIQANELQHKTDQVSALYQRGRSLSESIALLKVLMKKRGLCTGEVFPPMITITEDEENVYLSEIEEEWNKLI